MALFLLICSIYLILLRGREWHERIKMTTGWLEGKRFENDLLRCVFSVLKLVYYV